MKSNPRCGQPAFSLIELMAVITIIVILAGIVIGGMGFVNEKQAKAKAKVQIELISKALEEYKLDNGSYPATDDLSTPTKISGSEKYNSEIIFNALYFVGADDTNKEKKIYIGELDPTNNKQGWTSGRANEDTKILDPWGNEYLYRTAVNDSGKENSSTQNPDFDIWSAGKDGKSNEDTKHKDSLDDIRNY